MSIPYNIGTGRTKVKYIYYKNIWGDSLFIHILFKAVSGDSLFSVMYIPFRVANICGIALY